MKNIWKYIFTCGIAGIVCVLAFFSCLMSMEVQASENVLAASNAAIVSSRTSDDGIYIYIKDVGSIESGTTVQIGNTLCEDIQIASVASMGMPIKTMILFDNSQSLSQRWGSQSKELIKELIDSHAEGEEFKLATFADSLNVVADFSTEYNLLKTAVDGIAFIDQHSYLTDILHELLKQDEDSGEANYTRIIIITDGADDNDIKYTQAELSDLMKDSAIVIHAVGVKASKNNELLEKLFSYARFTKGIYKIAEKETNIEDIRDALNEDYSLLCLKLKPAAEVMDGGRKEAKLNLNTSGGMTVLRASLQMPFADVISKPSENAEPSASPVPTPPAEKPELPSIVVQSQPEAPPQETGMSVMIPVIAVSAVAFVIIVVLVVLLVFKGKKKKPLSVVAAGNGQPGGNVSGGAQEPSIQPGISAQPDIPPRLGRETKKLRGQVSADTSRTMRLQGGTGQTAERQAYITLTDIHNPQRSFRVPIDERIVIGREAGDILLGDDEAVSYTHCEIIKKGNLFYVNDLKSSNGTFYGNTRVYHETPVMNGGILEIGKYKYKITIEN